MIHKAIAGRRIIDDIRNIMATDRWNSFDRFHATSKTLCRLYESAGARSEIHSINTGGAIGSGKWIVREAADIRSASAEVILPVQRRILDYRKNPWHLVQWSANTPKAGLVCPLVILDTPQDIARITMGSLAGKAVLTRVMPRYCIKQLAAAGVLAVICDSPVPNNPDAVAWIKFGWGGIPIEESAVRLAGLVISENQGKNLRRLAQQYGPLTLRINVDVSYYIGAHDVVSGLVLGRDDPQGELWVLAHSSEPGALDNASGVAVCVAMARALETLIAQKRIPRPRRTIRFVNTYECYGFFNYLENARRFQRPLAGIDLDTLGARPEVCDGRLEWHANIPMSAGFVDRVGEQMLRAALRMDNPGYRLFLGPFVGHDTLISDPKYGFPCPWLTTAHKNTGKLYDVYHSSGETLNIMSARGLAVCAAAMAGYAGYLADAGTTEALEWATFETRHTIDRLTARPISSARREYLLEQHRSNMDGLRRWLWGGERALIQSHFAGLERRVYEASPRRLATAGRSTPDHTAVPRRLVPVVPCLDNVPAAIAKRIQASGLSIWAHYWANGVRSIMDIKRMLEQETGKMLDLARVTEYFEALAQLDYVQLVDPKTMITRSRLIADMKALGLQPGMDVMVHSSLSAIGPVRGGADTVIDAILAAIGTRGTLLMPSFNHHQAKVFNPLDTPTTNGAIPDAFWRRANAVRSDHPTHAVAAIGPKAEELCRDHIQRGLWTPACPLTRWIHEGGHILSIGVTHAATTALHVAECSLPCGCIDLTGNTYRMVAHDGSVRDVTGQAFRSRKCPVSVDDLSKLLDRRKLQRRGRIGLADSILAKGIDLWRVRREQLTNECGTCDIKPFYMRKPV